MTFPDLIKDLIDTSRERIKTPITGSFMLAFLIYNWRPIFLLAFSDAKIEDKIVVINHEYCTWYAILLPLLIAVVYVASIQYIMLWFDKLTTMAHKGRQVNRYNRQIHDLTTYRQVLEEQKTNENIRSGNLESSKLNDQIESLKNEYETLNQAKQLEKQKYENEIIVLTNTASDISEELLKYSKSASLNEKRNAYLIKDSLVYHALSELNPDQIKNFVLFVDFYVYRNSNQVSINATYEDEYINLNLIKYTNNTYSLTEFGKQLYEYLTIK